MGALACPTNFKFSSLNNFLKYDNPNYFHQSRGPISPQSSRICLLIAITTTPKVETNSPPKATAELTPIKLPKAPASIAPNGIMLHVIP